MKVFSGKCCLCDAGISVDAVDVSGKKLYTGDIVLVYNGRYIGTDSEEWYPAGGLTCVVGNQYQSYTDGNVEHLTDDFEPFVMGIKNCGFNHPEWQIHKVKSFEDVVSGEHWPDFGFSYE